MQCSIAGRTSPLNFTSESHGNCISDEPIDQTWCTGNCDGSQMPTIKVNAGSDIGKLEVIVGLQLCTCCQGTGLVIAVKVTCQHPILNTVSHQTVDFEYFTECSCRACLGGQNQQLFDY